MQNDNISSLPIIFTKIQYDEYYRNNMDRLVYREEFEVLSDIISQNDKYRILIKGHAGSGKTTLLKCLGYYNPYKTDIEIIRGFCFSEKDITDSNDKVLVIDALDEVQNQTALRNFLKNSRNQKLICTTRHSEDVDDLFEYIITLKPLSMAQMFNLCTRFIGDRSSLSEQKLRTIVDEAHYYTPREVIQLLIMNLGNELNRDKLLENSLFFSI